MSRRLDIGIASYKAPEKLAFTIASIQQQSICDIRIHIFHNPAPDDNATREVIYGAVDRDPRRIVAHWMPENVGYVGAVNRFFEIADGDFIAYSDNDTEVRTHGWDGIMCGLLEQNPELGWVFPGPGHYGFDNGKYRECLWNAGYFWVMRREAMERIGKRRPAADGSPGMDPTLGHHEEVDYMIRMRLDGWRVAACPQVNVLHHETATQSDSALHRPGGRIHDGVVRWMNKWNSYFCGDDLKYSKTAYDDRALRYTDWNVDALYLERMTLRYFPNLNANPETVNVPGVGEMDVIKVLKPKGPYKGRAI